MRKIVNENEIIYEFKSKEALLSEYIDNMDDIEQFDLWREGAYAGVVSPIDDIGDLDEAFSATDVLGFDLTHFDIDDHYYYVTSDALYSYLFFYEAMEDVGGKDDLIQWLVGVDVDANYICFGEDLRNFMKSDEYREAV